MKDTRKYWLWLSHCCGQGSRLAVDLVRRFGDAKAVFDAKETELEECEIEIRSGIFKKLCRKELSEEENILHWCDDSGVRVLVPDMAEYPKNLRALRDAPMVLYCIGTLPDFDSFFSCAVVGTRTMTDYGKNMAYKMGSGLADGGALVISGLALGVDGMAMAGALEADGICVGVLGCGIDVVYPKHHADLFQRVIRRGAIITEYAPGTSPRGENFPVRNRIISGLSQAVLVVEGNMKSGSLITARHAIFQGKDIYAVPGSVGEEGAEGTNHLLKQGAVPVTCAEDILRVYEFLYPHTITVDRLVPHVSADVAADNLGIYSKKSKKTAADAAGKENKAAKKPLVKKAKKEPEKLFEEGTAPRAAAVRTDELGEDERRIFEYMKPDVPMLAEEIIGCGLALPKVMVSLTMLELAGAVESGAGGYYMRRGADFGGEPEYITENDDGL